MAPRQCVTQPDRPSKELAPQRKLALPETEPPLRTQGAQFTMLVYHFSLRLGQQQEMLGVGHKITPTRLAPEVGLFRVRDECKEVDADNMAR